MTAIRKATKNDIPAIADVMAHAFQDDPLTGWVFRDAQRRPKYMRRFFAGRARILIRQNEIYTVDGCHAAAMWARPDEWHDPPLQSMKELAGLATGIRPRHIPQTLRGLFQIESKHPKPPHWYLAVLGTHPDHQGNGYASALVKPVLDECDRLEIPAYLETGKERNVAFYNRHGFRVTEQFRLPNGPQVWLMWRDPRP